MDINFELYKIFYHAAECGSFSLAATRLHVTQSAVSQAIKGLETKLGSQLFFRKTREIKLTPEGELLFKHVEQAFNFIRTAESKILESQNLETGEIRIGVSDTICKYYLIHYIEKFISNYPKVKIQVVNRTSFQIQNILKDGMIDFGIVTLPVHDKKLIIDNFITVEDIFVASQKFCELKDKTLTLNELIKYPLLMLDKSSSTRRNVDSYLSKIGINLLPEIELESIDLLIEFARIGLGIAHVLKESASGHIQSGELFQVRLSDKITLRKLGIITMKDVPLAKASREFIRFLKISRPM